MVHVFIPWRRARHACNLVVEWRTNDQQPTRLHAKIGCNHLLIYIGRCTDRMMFAFVCALEQVERQ